jgi:hypothetical protein
LHHHTLSNMLFDWIFKTHCAQILSCFSFGVSIWFIVQLIFLAFQLSSPIFSIVLWTQFGQPHPSIISIPRYMCTHPIDLVDIHLLGCVYGNECTGTHDVVCDIFVGFHMGRKQLHALLSTMFNSSRWQVNIIFIRNGIY